MSERASWTVDGNEAAATIAHLLSEVIAIYPITPASPMGELADQWSQAGRENLFGTVPGVIEMQSEGGAAGAVHGALQAGALSTTFTASQGLLLMLPNMFKIAGELTPCVIHVAARSVATHALSIFGDHSDVMAARTTGWAMLCAGSVQEAHDLALVAHAATLAARVPFVHFFDGFRTSHELNRIRPRGRDDVRALVDPDAIEAHRARALDPDRPVVRGTAQNPDVFFQARESCNPFYLAIPAHVRTAMDRLAERTGRRYGLFDYEGAPDADRVVVLMGSGAAAAKEAARRLDARGEKVGVLSVRLFRPFDARAFVEALPRTVRRIAVLDRTKEPGAPGEPLYQDVVTALAEAWPEDAAPPRVTGGRYGLSSKEFTPSMAAAVFREIAGDAPRRHFTIGIRDDVTHLSLDWDHDEVPEPPGTTRAVFFGLGSDGTVGANKNSAKILGEKAGLYAQAYFVYDSKKAGSVTVSHLRFGPEPIDSSYLVQRAGFVACHQFPFLERLEMLDRAEPGATFLLNSPHGPAEVWDRLPLDVQEAIVEKDLALWVIDAYRLARDLGLGGRINTIMQTCFFALTGILPHDEATAAIKEAIRETYGKRGRTIVERNQRAVDAALEGLARVEVPDRASAKRRRPALVPAGAPAFVQDVTARMLGGEGDLLPTSALPVDGTFPVGTARFEKRSIAREIPIWEPDVCIQCGLCALVCPHAAIRSKVYAPSELENAPEGFESRPWTFDKRMHLTIQVAPDDCTGCHLCVEACPARDKEVARRKAINMEPKDEHLARERAGFDFFLGLPEIDRTAVDPATVQGSQLLQPLFEFSGACAGCGETPYLKLLTQLFGDRMVVANATGCSSIYGGNLPTTPWAADDHGRGPAWSNSLFEDNAEFGLGMRLALDAKERAARALLGRLRDAVGADLADGILAAPQRDEAGLAAQRARIAALKEKLAEVGGADAEALRARADVLVRRSVWIVGGDGWAYDIGFGGLDHVLASGADVNVIVLDTEVYSNTGGQASKATPLGAVAKFASGGKGTPKKDLGRIAMAHGHVYVAQIAMGANPRQTIRALREAESFPGPSLLIAYSQCIAHGLDMAKGMEHQKEAMQCGYWPLYRHDPRLAVEGKTAFQLDSRKPTLRLEDFAMKEARFAMLARADPERARTLMRQAEEDIRERRRVHERLAFPKPPEDAS